MKKECLKDKFKPCLHHTLDQSLHQTWIVGCFVGRRLHQKSVGGGFLQPFNDLTFISHSEPAEIEDALRVLVGSL